MVRAQLTMSPLIRAAGFCPPAQQRLNRWDSCGPSFLFVSRLTPLKRADLLIRALATADGAGIHAVVVGEGEERTALERLAEACGVATRVTFAGRVSDDEAMAHYARCRAVVFPPLQEDYGFVTVEAFASRKAVITCRDSGGPAELVQDGVNGAVCDPTPDALARAMRQFADDPALAERLGAAAHASGSRLTWPETVSKLVQ